ncbi:hypothetical protein OH77DRAFT_1413574, partial [Trametes cingulata]
MQPLVPQPTHLPAPSPNPGQTLRSASAAAAPPPTPPAPVFSLRVAGAVPKRLRLIDCVHYLRDQTHIQILESTVSDEDLPPATNDALEDYAVFSAYLGDRLDAGQRWATVSYPWVPRHSPDPGENVFRVDGIRDPGASHISHSVLLTICAAAVQHGCNFLWLDKLCIIQGDEDDADKVWHIWDDVAARMYRGAALCIVAPDGLQRLATLWDETMYVHRCWTFFEAVMARTETVKVLH